MTDSRKIKYLGKTLLRLEVRSSDGSLRKLLLINLSFLLPAILISGLMYLQKVTPLEFAFISFLVFSVLIIFTVVNELDNLLISENECEIYSVVPLSWEMLTGAKMYMLTRFVLLMSFPLYIPASVFYYLLSDSLGLSVIYIINGYIAGYFFVNLVILFYAFAVRNFKISRSSNFRLLIQMFMIIFLILSYQFISYGITGKETISQFINKLNENQLIEYIPSFWFAFVLSTQRYIFDFAYLVKIIVPYIIFIFSYISLRNYLRENYASIIENIVMHDLSREKQNKHRASIFDLFYQCISRYYLRRPLERASYGLVRSMLKKDKTVRSSIFPVMILPTVLAFFGLITNQLPDPFSQGYLESKPVFHISVLLSVVVVLNAALLGIRASNSPEATWIYYTYPMVNRSSFISGIRKFFQVNFLIPLVLPILVITSFSLIPIHAFINSFFIFSCAMLYNSLFFRLAGKLPFTEKNTTINSLKRIGSMMIPFLFGIVMVTVQIFVYNTPWMALSAALVIFFISVLTDISNEFFQRKI